MNKISTPIATYERSFGTLTAVTSPDKANSLAGDRLNTIYEGFHSGIPGYVGRGAMTAQQVLEYMSVKLAPPSPHSGAALVERPVDILLSPSGLTDELVATADFGETRTPAGLLVSRDGTRIAHVSTFAVSKRPLERELLSPSDLSEVALALGHATLTAASTEFDEISYRVEETTRSDVLDQLAALGLSDEVEERGEIAHFAVTVADAPGMVRTEYAVNIKAARDAMEATHPWLAAGASQ